MQIDLPESFYDRSAQEIKNEYAKTHQNNETSKMLMTKAYREALKDKTRKVRHACSACHYSRERVILSAYRLGNVAVDDPVLCRNFPTAL